MPPKISKEIKLSQIQESKTRVVVCIAIHFAASRGNVVKIKELCSEARRLGRDILKLADPNGSTALHIAAFYGQVESIKVLCAEAGDKKFELLKVKSVGGQTPLDQAAYKGHAKAIEALLAEAGDKKFELLTIKSAGGRTPLHQAAQYNKLGAIKELLKLTLNQKKNLLKAATDSGHTALHLAAQEGNAEVIRDLCLAAGDKKEGLLKAATEDGHTALHLAATQGHAAAIKALCDAADDQEQKEALFKPVTKQGMTALHAAAHNGHVEAIKALCALCIEAGDQKQKEKLLTAATDAGHTALHLAAKHGHAAAITALLAEAGDLKQKIELLKAKAINWDGYTALHYAAEYGHLDVIEELFLAAGCQKGELLKVFTTKKLTVLHLAATFGHVAAIKAIFIAAGDQKQREALLEAVDIDGDTALHLAAQHGEAEVIQALSLAAGDKKEKLLNAADMRGYRALHLAAQNGHVKAIDALCKEAGDQKQREALLEAVDNAGDTALHLAAYCGNAAAIKVLCEVAGDQKQELLKSDKMDATPLHYAAQNGHVKAIEALCEEAGDQKQKEEMLKAATRSDQTALHLAATQGHVGVIEYLLAMAGDIKEELLNAVNMDGNTALHEAAHNGHADAIISLFEKAGDQEQKEALLKSANKSGHKALDLAARCGNTAAIKALCEAAGDKKNELLKAVNKDNLTALHLAAKHGHAAAITAILAEAGDQKQELLKAVYNNGLTALYVAAYNNNIEATNELYVEALKAGVKKEELLKVDSEKGRKLLINLRDEKVAISLIEFISESSRKKLLNASLVNENYHLYQNPEIKNIYMLVMAVDGMPLDGIEAVNFKDMPEEFPRDLKEALKLTDEQAHTAIEIVTEYNKKNRSPTAEGTTFHDLIAPYKINYVSKLKTLDCAIELLDRGFLNEIPSGNEDSVELLESKVSSNAAIPAKKSPEAASVVGFAPETLRKPVSKTCSAPSLSASMGILGKRQSELLKDKVSDGVNLCYQYEDYDIAAILNIRLAQEVTAPGELGGDGRIQVLAPTDGLSPGILEMQLRENREQFTGARVVIIPYNVGHYHWIGILLEFSAENLITRALHIDSSGRNELETLQNRLNRAGYRYQEGVALSPVTLLTQTDGTSCGAYTIENLILALINQGVPNPPPTAEMIRRKHITCLETYRPEFYRGDSGFYQRQLENRITALNTGFNRGETSSVVFSPFELRKILDVSQLIEKFSNEVLRKQLWQALQPQAAYQDNIKLHLDAIRKTIKALARSLSAPEEESADKDNLRDLIEILFGTSWTIGKEVTDEQLDSFCVDYEQIKAIAKRKDTKAASPEQTEIKNKILEQIKSDEEFAKKLQSQFYSEKIDAVVVTGNMHTIPTQAVHRLFTGGDDIVPSVAEIPAEVDNLGEKLVPDTDFRKVSGAKPSADEVSGDFLAGIASSNDSASAKEKKVDEIKERVETHLRYLGLTNSPIFKDSYNQLVNIIVGQCASKDKISFLHEIASKINVFDFRYSNIDERIKESKEISDDAKTFWLNNKGKKSLLKALESFKVILRGIEVITAGEPLVADFETIEMYDQLLSNVKIELSQSKIQRLKEKSDEIKKKIDEKKEYINCANQTVISLETNFTTNTTAPRLLLHKFDSVEVETGVTSLRKVSEEEGLVDGIESLIPGLMEKVGIDTPYGLGFNIPNNDMQRKYFGCVEPSYSCEIDLLREHSSVSDAGMQVAEQKKECPKDKSYSETVWTEGLKYFKLRLILKKALELAGNGNYELLSNIEVQHDKKNVELSIHQKLELFKFISDSKRWKLRVGNKKTTIRRIEETKESKSKDGSIKSKQTIRTLIEDKPADNPTSEDRSESDIRLELLNLLSDELFGIHDAVKMTAKFMCELGRDEDPKEATARRANQRSGDVVCGAVSKAVTPLRDGINRTIESSDCGRGAGARPKMQ